MPITYTNRKGRTYFLCKGKTKTGKTRYYFAGEQKGEPVDEIPEGYKISESVNGIVSLAKDRPSLIHAKDVAVVEAEIKRHPKRRRYRVRSKHDRIEVYEMAGPDAEDLAEIYGDFTFSKPVEQAQTFLDSHSQFRVEMRFILADPENHTFRAQRWCYLGSIDDWIDIDYGSIEHLAKEWIPLLGTDELFNRY
ncbi:MAG: hypothetical protein P8X90_34860 [Desulfobacterales bacterium]